MSWYGAGAGTMAADQVPGFTGEPIRWTEPNTWRPRIAAILNALSEGAAIQKLADADVSGLYEDDPDWVSLVAEAVDAPEQRLVEAVAARLAGSTVRVFHGTRTEDAGSFVSEGIRLHDRQRMEAEARALVRRAELQWLEAVLDERFAQTDHLIDHGRCYVVVDERVLVEECGHYLLGGSEFLQGVIGPELAQSVLRWCAPTVIEVDLPLRSVSDPQQIQFASSLVGDWARMLRRRRSEARRLDFTFVLREAVPPSWIMGHFHPTVVRDPHRMRRAVKSAVTSCRSCGPTTRPTAKCS